MDQQRAVEGALQEVGWVQQVLVNRTTGHLVDGHLRVELAISRGEPSPVTYLDLTSPSGGRSPLRVGSFPAGAGVGKVTLVLGHSDYHFRHEPILYGYAPGAGRPGRGRHDGSHWGGNAQAPVFAIDRPKRSVEHPTLKPVERVERCLSNSTRPGAMVLNPFAGSGSTIIAAERIGRACYGVDIDPRYVQVAIERWRAFTGREAVKVDG